MRKKVLAILIFYILFISKSIFANIDEVDTSAKYIGVYNLDNLMPLYEKNPQAKTSIASITKIMTAIVCIDNIDDLNKIVIVDLPQVEKYYDEDYSTAGLKDKQEISYYDLIATMLIPSGADSAACIALNVFGDYNLFINKMNEKAKKLGMNDTSFSNPIGSDDINNYSTIKDISLMMKYALNNEIIRKLMSEYEYTTKDGSIKVHNALFQLADIYGMNVEKISGGKTGMTDNAGYCLASYSEKTKEPIMCIVLGCEIRRGTLYHLSDSEKIYEYINNNYSYTNVLNKGDRVITLPTYHSTQNNIELCSNEDVKLYVEQNNVDKDKIKVEYSGVEVLSPTNKKGDIVGKASVYYDGVHISDVDVIVNEKIQLSLVKWSKDNKKQSFVIILIIAIVLLYCIIKIKLSNRKKNKYKSSYKI